MAFVANIEDETLNNKNYRRVIYTSTNLNGMQLVLMSLKPEEEIGMEKHPGTDQFIRIEKGEATVIIGKIKKEIYTLKDTDAIVIPANTWHNVINVSHSKELKLYTIYTPPEHKPGTVQKLKPKLE
jgi:mannose-6-phosphate isomerase-like protein (cupin superfamily)